MKTITSDSRTNRFGLPESFEPILWSYRFADFDPDESPQTLIVQTLSYGTLGQWRWLLEHYGRDELCAMIASIPETALRPSTRRLVSIVFDISKFHYAQRSPHR